MTFLSCNGRLLSDKKPVVGIDDSSYLYGHGVFETLRATRGDPLFLKEHWERMATNCNAVGITRPFTEKQLQKHIHAVLKKNRLQEANLRLTISESIFSPKKKTHWSLWARPFVPYAKANYDQGGFLILVKGVLNDPRVIANMKSTNYLTKVLARKEIAQRQAVEGVLLNSAGYVTEGASSNIFIVRKKRILTPPLSEGLMPGVRRQLIINLAKKEGILVLEKRLRLGDLENADEIFITSSLKEILPIARFEKRTHGKGPVTSHLMNLWNSRFLPF